MAVKISFLKKIKLFKEYKKAIKSYSIDLESKYGIRIDRAYRLYTVLNIPEEFIGDSYGVKKSDIDRISENYIKQFIGDISVDLDYLNIKELYRVYEVKKVDKYSYLIVIGFSLFKSNEFYDSIYFRFLPIIGILSGISLLSFLIYKLFQ